MARSFMNVTVGAVSLLFLFALAKGQLWPLFGVSLALVASVASYPRLSASGSAPGFWLLFSVALASLDVLQDRVTVLGRAAPFDVVLIGGVAVSVAALAVWLWACSDETRHWRRGLAISGFLAVGLGIAFLSGPQGGPGRFVHFLTDVLHLSAETAMVVNFVVRKAVHLTAYGTLAWCAAEVARQQGGPDGRALAAGYAWAVPLAVFDEVSQTMVATRTGSLGDVFLDAVGMTLFLWPFWRRVFWARGSA